MSEYEDEFDVAGRERGPEGVHREPRSLLRTLLPYLAVIVLVPFLAWGVVALISGGGDSSEDAPQATAPPTEQVEPTDDATEPEGTTPPGETTDPTTEATTEPGLGADVVETASISVLNGTSTSGFAAENAALLEEAGFTTVGAADYGSGSPDVTTLYYRNAELAPTAEAIGEVLGITNLVELASATQNVEIAIVLRADLG